MLEELTLLRSAIKPLAIQEVVVARVDLALARRARGRGDRQLEPWHAPKQLADQGPLPDPRRSGDHEYLRHSANPDGRTGPIKCENPRTARDAPSSPGMWAAYMRSWPTSSPRWRSERPPIVFDGEIRHWVRILFALTRPYLGTARIMSNAFADMT